MACRILIVADGPHVSAPYEAALKVMGVDFSVAGSFGRIRDTAALAAYNGVVFDAGTVDRLPRKERDHVRELVDVFPVIKLRHEGTLDQRERTKLEFFIRRPCAAFAPRSLRAAERIPCMCNVLLSTDIGFTGKRLERTITMNVSEGGCFLFYAGEWKFHDRVFFTIKELGDDTPVIGQIRWHKEWGTGMHVPGFGLRFQEIRQEQLGRLMEIAHAAQPGASIKAG